MRPHRRGQSLKRGDRVALDCSDAHRAGPLRLAVHQDRARTALAKAAPELGGSKTYAAQHIEQGFVRVCRLDRTGGSIDLKSVAGHVVLMGRSDVSAGSSLAANSTAARRDCSRRSWMCPNLFAAPPL